MTALAYGIHEKLVGQGIRPDTEEYFQGIDKGMRESFPKYFRRAPRQSTVVAPAGRSTGGKSSRVTLTPTAAALAKRLGLTPEQYAEQQRRLNEDNARSR